MNRRRRAGFTLVELMVAMALIIFILYVIAEAFSAGAKAFRDLKAVGDMNERLRSASSVLRRLLQADHFENRKRLSDASFWDDGPPQQGFFRIWQNSQPSSTNLNAAYFQEGTDLDGNTSFRATDHGLHFTARLRGTSRGEFFRTSVPAGSPLLSLPWPAARYQDFTPPNQSGIFAAPWAEVAIFLKPSGDDTSLGNDPSAGTPQNLFTLHIRQRLLVSDNSDVTPAVQAVPGPAMQTLQAQYMEVSQQQDPSVTPQQGQQVPLYFNNPADVTMPVRRFPITNKTSVAGPTNLNPTSPGFEYRTFQQDDFNGLLGLAGSDVLLTDVLSMEVRVLLAGGTDFVHLFDPSVQAFSMGNPSFYDSNKRPNSPAVFDTWSSRTDNVFDYSSWSSTTPNPSNSTVPLYQNTSSPPAKIRITAVQITLRVWDSKTKQSRQTSVVVDM